jgi:hypothetical protein
MYRLPVRSRRTPRVFRWANPVGADCEHKDDRGERLAVDASDDELDELLWVAKGCHASLPMGKSRRCRLRESKRWQELSMAEFQMRLQMTTSHRHRDECIVTDSIEKPIAQAM